MASMLNPIPATPSTDVLSTRRGKKKESVTAEGTSRTLISYLERRRLSVRITMGIITAVLFVGAFTFLLPMIWLFVGSIKSSPELLKVPPTLLPDLPQWHTYGTAWTKFRFGQYFMNTLIIVVVGWFIPMAVNLLAAYSLSKMRPAFGNAVMFCFLMTFMVPGVVYLIPLYIIMVNLHLNNTWLSLWLPGAFSAYSILIAKGFFDSIPHELNDSAVIDGANPLQILWHIILPLSRPLIVVLSIGLLIGGWQQFFPAYLYINDPEIWPIGTALFSLFPQQGEENVKLAALVITALPMIIFYAIFQRQIIRGINLSGFMTG